MMQTRSNIRTTSPPTIIPIKPATPRDAMAFKIPEAKTTITPIITAVVKSLLKCLVELPPTFVAVSKMVCSLQQFYKKLKD